MRIKISNKLKLSILVVGILLGSIGYIIIKRSVVDVKLVEIRKIQKKVKITLNGEVVPKDVEFLYKKVRMKVKRTLAIPGSKVKKGDTLLTYYGVTKDGYNESLDSEVREDLNEKIILLDSLKHDLKEMEYQAQVLRVRLSERENVERVMKKLLDEDRGTSIELIGAKDAVMLTELEYQKTLKVLSVLKKTVRLKSIVIEKEISERSVNTLAPEDGLIISVDVKNGENVIPAKTLIIFASNDSGLEVELNISKSIINDVNMGDKVSVIKNNFKNKTIQTFGVLSKLSDIETKLERNGDSFDGLIGTVSLDDTRGFKIKDQVKIGLVEYKGGSAGGISTFSVFDISKDKKSGYVYIVENGVAKKRKVVLGENINHKYEILDMPIGALLIGNPYKLKEGKKVNIIE